MIENIPFPIARWLKFESTCKKAYDYLRYQFFYAVHKQTLPLELSIVFIVFDYVLKNK